jgi:hypothetical protein
MPKPFSSLSFFIITGNSVKCSGSQQSNNSANATNLLHEEQLPETKQLQKDPMIATTDQVSYLFYTTICMFFKYFYIIIAFFNMLSFF